MSYITPLPQPIVAGRGCDRARLFRHLRERQIGGGGELLRRCRHSARGEACELSGLRRQLDCGDDDTGRRDFKTERAFRSPGDPELGGFVQIKRLLESDLEIANVERVRGQRSIERP